MSTKPESELIRLRVIYHGHVQGVCFRAVSVELARGTRAVGFVRNLPDGTVELEAEGARAEVETLLRRIGDQFRRNISRADRTILSPRRMESRFDVAY
jgi:acylphosphatase